MRYFTFSCIVFKFWYVFYTYSPFQFGIIVFQVLNSHTGLVAPILDDTALDRKKVGGWDPKPWGNLQQDGGRPKWHDLLIVFLSLAILPPSRASWKFPAQSALASRVSKMKGLGRTEEIPEGLDFCPGAYNMGQGSATAIHRAVPCCLRVGVHLCTCVFQRCSRTWAPTLRELPAAAVLVKSCFLHNNHIRQCTRDGTFHSSGMLCKDCQMEAVS